MTDETTKVAPTLAELEAKVSRLSNQVEADKAAATSATDAFSKAVKSGNVDAALDLADKRTSAQVTVGKSISQHKSAMAAVQSAKWAANAEQVASVHDDVRDGKITVPDAFKKLEAFGVERLVVERSGETGKLLINSSGPTLKKARGGGGGGGGGKSTPVTVDGQSFASAAAALAHFRPDFTGKMGVSAITSWLTNNGHEVS